MTTRLQPDDPRLTAYALGELPADEIAAFEQLVAESPEAQREVTDIRRMAEWLSQGLATGDSTEGTLELSPSQRDAIRQAAMETAQGTPIERELQPAAALPPVEPVAKRRFRGERWRAIAYFTAGLLAASIVIALALPVMNPDASHVLVEALAWNDRGAEGEALPAPYYVQDDVQSAPPGPEFKLSRGAAEMKDKRTARIMAKTPSVKALAHDGTNASAPQSVALGDGQNAPATPADGAPTSARELGYTVSKPVYEKDKRSQSERSVRGRQDGDPMTDEAMVWGKPTSQPHRGSVMLGLNLNGSLAEGVPADAYNAGHHYSFFVDFDSDGAVGGRLSEVERLSLIQEGGGQRGVHRHNTEAYDPIVENPILGVIDNPLSTFSIDVDTASYANVRRFLSSGQLPPPGAVRIEELLNYFPYSYTPPTDNIPFAVHAEVAECPWTPGHRLLRIALKGREIPDDKRPNSNLVFLLDVSGSMQDPNKLPLVKAGMKLLVERLRPTDRVAMAVYAGASGLVLESTSGEDKTKIMAAIDRLEAGGSTNGAAGIQLAYETARANLIREGTNRVILCTDGDFNVGVTDQSQLTDLIEKEAKSGVFLSVLGFGMGNYKDSTLEKLADKGNGNYAYVDGMREARKVLVEQLTGTLITIAKDVKLQIEFNPARVAGYRLIGYENRMLAKEDFQDDTKDAGEIGAGHTVTALYELIPAGEKKAPARPVAPLEYQRPAELTPEAEGSPNLLTLKLRYKQPDKDTSDDEIRVAVADSGNGFGQSSKDLQFAAAVAQFGMLLRGSQFAGSSTWDSVLEIAGSSLGEDKEGYRREFIELAERARALKPATPVEPQAAPVEPQPGAPASPAATPYQPQGYTAPPSATPEQSAEPMQ